MAFCSSCGAELPQGAFYCARCGAAVMMAQPQYQNIPVQQPKKRELNIPMLVFSIIVTAVGNFVLGLIALVMTIMATDEKTDQREQDKLKLAKILNIIGAVLGGVSILVGIVSYILFTRAFFDLFSEIFVGIM